MDVQSGLFMILSTLGLLLLIVMLISFLIKPGRKLKVSGVFKQGSGESDKTVIELQIENIGKKPMDIVYVYARFYDRFTKKKIRLISNNISTKLPHFIKKGESLHCELDIGDSLDSVKKESFDPGNVKIIVANSSSMEFLSNPLEL